MHSDSKTQNNKGFTLIELMVTIAIVTVIMGIILIENSKFNDSIILTNTAYEIALVARQAQVFGLSSKAASSGTIYSGYGINASAVDGENSVVHLFADNITANGKYDAGEEITGGIQIGRGIRVTHICFYYATERRCNESEVLKKTNVTFKRPNPESDIRDGSGSTPAGVKQVQINVNTSASTNESRCVIIYKSGQISVKSGNTNCPTS